MITLRKTGQRRYDHRRRLTAWHTFYPRDRAAPIADRFGVLESLSEYRLPPDAHALRHLHHDAEIVTYVRQGTVAHEDSTGRSGVIHAGEFQRMTATQAVRLSETNASLVHWAHVFQIWLRPLRDGLAPGHERKRFSAAERRGVLRVVASPDARRGSLRIHQDAAIYSALLGPGQHLIHELTRGRSAWLHLVQGEATLGGVLLATGDGVGVTAERAVSLTAREESEIILLDLCKPQ